MARGRLASPAPLSGRVGRGELNAASGNGFAILPTQFCSRDPSPTRLSPLLPNPAFLFCILHRGEIPYPAFISPLPTLPLKDAGFARWPLRSLPRWFVECGTIRERRDCVRPVALQSRAVHTRPHAP